MTTNNRLFQYFSDKIKETDKGCWIWVGTLDKDGYGQVTVNNKTRRAHRFFYINLVNPKLTSKIHLHHICEVKSCVNPDHLEEIDPRAHVDIHITGRGRFKLGQNCPDCGSSNVVRKPSNKEVYCRDCNARREQQLRDIKSKAKREQGA